MEEEGIPIQDFQGKMGMVEEVFIGICSWWIGIAIRWLHPFSELGPLLGGILMKMKLALFEGHKGISRVATGMLTEMPTVSERLEMASGMQTTSEKVKGLIISGNGTTLVTMISNEGDVTLMLTGKALMVMNSVISVRL